METLTKRQAEILNVVKKYIAKNHYPPTVREIGAILGLKSPATTHFHLDCLAEKGYITKGASKNRAIHLLVQNEYDKEEGQTLIPMLGLIPAGNPKEAIENATEFFPLPEGLLSKHKELFALTVHGESMINKGIYDGDIVVIEKCKNANNGDVVAAMTEDNEVTLKTFYKEDNHIRLQPENDTMKPIILNNVTILGKAKCLYRNI